MADPSGPAGPAGPAGPGGRNYFAEHALLPSGLARNVTFAVRDGRFTAVTASSEAGDAERLPGLVVPGFANAHSHAFHRALRGRTHDEGGTFWTWRRRMYAVAEQLDPETYLGLARAAYAEMALAGVTSVGEFHYLHHGPGGVPYAEPNVMAEALRQAAAEAGVRLTLLDTCYLTGGLTATGHLPLDAVQRRFSDGTVEAWQARVGSLRTSPGTQLGVAIHSVRAVPAAALPGVAEFAAPFGDQAGLPLHAHVSEQPAENEAALGFYGRTPTELLAAAGALGESSTAVHATHLTVSDIEQLGRSASTVCFCPTTERDLADGIGPARALADAGARLSLGSDQHAVTDLLEEARALEVDERLASRQRGRFQPWELLSALTAHASIGWPEAGRLAAGALADLVAVRLDSVRTAGCEPSQALMAATASDVDTVICGGRRVVMGGRHELGDVGRMLDAAITPLWASAPTTAGR